MLEKGVAKQNQHGAREIEKAAHRKAKERGVPLNDETYRKIDQMYD